MVTIWGQRSNCFYGNPRFTLRFPWQLLQRLTPRSTWLFILWFAGNTQKWKSSEIRGRPGRIHLVNDVRWTRGWSRANSRFSMSSNISSSSWLSLSALPLDETLDAVENLIVLKPTFGWVLLYWPHSELSATLYVLRTMTMPAANLGKIPCYFSGRLKNQLNDFSRNGFRIQLLH